MSKQKTILIADDSWFIRQGVGKLLKKLNYTVVEASNGQQAIDLISTANPDLAILDFLMPDMNGDKILEFLSQNKLKIPVILLTADIQETTKKRCIDLGAKDFLNKPPNAEKLVHSIRNILD